MYDTEEPRNVNTFFKGHDKNRTLTSDAIEIRHGNDVLCVSALDLMA